MKNLYFTRVVDHTQGLFTSSPFPRVTAANVDNTAIIEYMTTYTRLRRRTRCPNGGGIHTRGEREREREREREKINELYGTRVMD